MIWGDSLMTEQTLFQESDGGSNPTSPLQLNFNVINPKVASELNKKWHSRLPEIHWSNIVRNKYQICFGALYNSNYFAVAIWSSPVARAFDYHQVLELRRLAISNECPKNTATRMLGFMQRYIKKHMPQITLLISYQDTDVHNGTIYKAANWIPAAKTKYGAWNISRDRNKSQSTADKIRWEYRLKEQREIKIKINNKQLDLL